MKKVFLLLISTCLTSTLSAQWLGTNPVYFNSGKVGIGTSSPIQKLQVHGNIYAVSGVFYSDNNYGLRNSINDYGIYPYSTYLQFRYNGNEAMRISSTGNVGIGTTSPSSPLEIKSGLNRTIRLNITGIGANSTYTWQSLTTNSLEQWRIVGRNSDNANLEFWDKNQDRVLTMTQSGNIGIGTTAPNGLLDVKRASSSSAEMLRFTDGAYKLGSIQSLGSADGSGLLMIGRTEGISTPVPALTLVGYANDVSPDNDYDAAVTVRAYDVSDGSKLTNMPVFRVMNSHTDVHLSVEANGNVGIGTTSPSYKLDVNGVIGVKGQRLIDDNGTSLLIGDLAGGDGYRALTLRAGDQDRLHINTSGNVGIGTTSPSSKLQISHETIVGITYGTNKGLGLSSSDGGGALYGNDINHSIFFRKGRDGSHDVMDFHEFGDIRFFTNGFIENQSQKMVIKKTGNVGIGTTSPTEKLSVDGNILAKKVRVSVSPVDWPDYVFAPSYELRALSEVENYIKENQHLPDVPSAKEVETNGLDLGNMDAALLKKVEELTLYTIDQQKKIDQQAKENQELKDRLNKIEALIKTLTSK